MSDEKKNDRFFTKATMALSNCFPRMQKLAKLVFRFPEQKKILKSKIRPRQDLPTGKIGSFFKRCPGRGRTWDLLVFVYFLSLKQRLRPLGYCAPLTLLALANEPPLGAGFRRTVKNNLPNLFVASMNAYFATVFNLNSNHVY